MKKNFSYDLSSLLFFGYESDRFPKPIYQCLELKEKTLMFQLQLDDFDGRFLFLLGISVFTRVLGFLHKDLQKG